MVKQDTELREKHSAIHAFITNMTTERIIGFILLLIGVGIIFYSLYASYGIFTGTQNPPEFYSFSIEAPARGEPQKPKSSLSSPEEIQGQFQDIIAQQLENLLPTDTIPKTLNLFIWSLFAGILIFGGGQIAGIGVKVLAMRKSESSLTRKERME